MHALKNPNVTGILWLAVRLYVGYEWLMGGIEKVFGAGSANWVGANAGKSVTGFLKGAIAKSPLAEGFDPAKTPHPAVQEWYATLIRDVFIPNAVLFSYLVAVGELLIGVALILGIFTRFSATMSVLLAFALFFGGAVSTLPQLIALSFPMMLVGTNAGRFGLDYIARPIEIKLFNAARARFTYAPTTA